MQKICDRVKINNESAWANSRVEYNVGDTATLYLKPSDYNMWFAFIK